MWADVMLKGETRKSCEKRGMKWINRAGERHYWSVQHVLLDELFLNECLNGSCRLIHVSQIKEDCAFLDNISYFVGFSMVTVSAWQCPTKTVTDVDKWDKWFAF